MKFLAIITGAGTGIGKALSLELMKKNIKVIGVGRRAEPLAQLKAQAPEHFNFITADLGTPEGRNTVINTLKKQGPICYLVHNAGMIEPIESLATIKPQGWYNAFELNLHAPLFLTQALLPQLQKGRVLHISSGLAHFARAGNGAYSTTKAALYMLYQTFKAEMTQKEIYFGSVQPGIVETAMQEILRAQDNNKFPDTIFYKELKQNGQLVPVDTCGVFLAWLLTETTSKDFCKKEWDIYEKEHHHLWLGNRKLPIPNF